MPACKTGDHPSNPTAQCFIYTISKHTLFGFKPCSSLVDLRFSQCWQCICGGEYRNRTDSCCLVAVNILNILTWCHRNTWVMRYPRTYILSQCTATRAISIVFWILHITLTWCPWRDSNPQHTRSKRADSTSWPTWAIMVRNERVELPARCV